MFGSCVARSLLPSTILTLTYKPKLAQPPTLTLDSRIDKIDGQPWMDYVIDSTKSGLIHTSRDPNARFNMALEFSFESSLTFRLG